MNDPHLPPTATRDGYLWRHPVTGRLTTQRRRRSRWHGPHPLVWAMLFSLLLWAIILHFMVP